MKEIKLKKIYKDEEILIKFGNSKYWNIHSNS